MARKTTTILTSDKSGAKIAEGSGGTVRIRTAAGVAYRADVTSAELNALVKELNAVKIGSRADNVARRAAEKAAAEDEGEGTEPGDGEGGEDEGEEPEGDDVEMTPSAPSEPPADESKVAA